MKFVQFSLLPNALLTFAGYLFTSTNKEVSMVDVMQRNATIEISGYQLFQMAELVKRAFDRLSYPKAIGILIVS
jgi:hypothetical protein